MKKTFAFVSGLGVALLPVVALAQNFNPSYPTSVINAGKSWLGTAITVIMVLMTFYFLVKVFQYIANKDAGKVAEKRGLMIQALIGLFIAVSVWGIIKIAGTIFGTNGVGPGTIQCPPGSHQNLVTGACDIN